MRHSLIAAVALAPLCFAAGEASATTTVSANRTTPIATSTANGGKPDDVVINSGVTVSGTTNAAPLVTIDSSNTVSNAGTITLTDVNSSTAVQINGGNTGGLTNTGSIINTTSYTPSDSKNSDGVYEAPYGAKDSSANSRFGVRLIGPGAFTGDILNDTTGVITVKGNQSYAVAIDSQLTGNLINKGSISYTGDAGAGIRTSAAVTKDIRLNGAVTVVGNGSNALNLGGDIGGALRFYSSVTNTGYGTTTRPTNLSALNNIQNTPEDVQQSGQAVIVGGNVAGGIFISAPPSGTVSTDTTTDADKDGTVDSAQTTGTITNYGSAAALQIGGAGSPITIGAFNPLGTIAKPYGLVIAGNVTGQGVYDGVNAQAIQVTNATINGGIRISGTVSASGYNGVGTTAGPNQNKTGITVTGLALSGGASVPELRLETTGTLIATQLHSTLGSATDPTGASATAVAIDATSSLQTLTNLGTIQASVVSDVANATAVSDLGGQLATVENQGVIGATHTALTTATYTGRTIALDLSHNTSGVTLRQETNPSPPSGSTATTPLILGDVLLGSGTNTVQLLAGSITGALDFGSGAGGAFTIDNGATYTGKFRYGGSGIVVNVNNGTLFNTNAATYAASSLTVGSKGLLVFAVDPANNTSAQLQVAGAATFASGSQVGLSFNSLLTGTQTYTLVKAGSLSYAGNASALLTAAPFLYAGTLAADTAAGTLNLTLRQKTGAELGLNRGEASGLSGVLAGLSNDPAIQATVLGQYTQSGFQSVYRQLLPDYSGGAFEIVSEATRAIAGATAQAPEIEQSSGTHGLWAQEFTLGIVRDRGDAAAYHAGGFGFIGGFEVGGRGYGDFGLTASFYTADVTNPDVSGDDRTSVSSLDAGLYWQGEMKGFHFDARAGAGYVWLKGQRQFSYTPPANSGATATTADATTAVFRSNKSDRNGWDASVHAGASWQGRYGRWSVRPQVRLDYVRYEEDGYTETPLNGTAAGLNYTVASRSSDEGSATASLVIGTSFGRDFKIRPEIELGVRDVFAGDIGNLSVKLGTGAPFALTPFDVTGTGGIARAKVKLDSRFYEIGLEAGGEARSGYLAGDARATIRVLF